MLPDPTLHFFVAYIRNGLNSLRCHCLMPLFLATPDNVMFYTDVLDFVSFFFFFQAEDGIRDADVTGVQTCALPILVGGEPALETFTHDLGSVEVYLEALRPRPRLVVLGATPVAEHLLRGGAELGYATVLVEPRAERITPAHRAAAGRVEASVADITLGPAVDAVHTDHDAPDIVAELAPLLRAGVRFVGVMGSARHTAPHLEALPAAGCTDDELARLRTPVGLDLGARTPAEIALSILAGLLAARTGRTGGWLDRR